MNQEKLYDIIFKRRSIRKYDLDSLDIDTINEILTFSRELRPLYAHIQTEIKLVSHKDIRNLLPIKAPHYLIIFSEEKDGYLTNAGFMFQQMDLFLSLKGLGSCWLGMAKPSKEIIKHSQLGFVIILAFGKPEGELHRKSLSEFKRKPLENITNCVNEEELLEPVRLAPSASNGQPWFIKKDGNRVYIYCVKQNPIKSMIYSKMNKIDIGIAIYHLSLAAEHLGKKVTLIDKKQNLNFEEISGYNYVETLIIEN